MKTTPDMNAAVELQYYIMSDYRSYIWMLRINGRLEKKYKLGIYDAARACRAFESLAKYAAIMYCKAYGSPDTPYYDIFNAATRREVCKGLEDHFRYKVEEG